MVGIAEAGHPCPCRTHHSVTVANTSMGRNNIGRWGTARGMSPMWKEPRAPRRICSTWTLVVAGHRPLGSSTFKAGYPSVVVSAFTGCGIEGWAAGSSLQGHRGARPLGENACTCTHPSHSGSSPFALAGLVCRAPQARFHPFREDDGNSGKVTTCADGPSSTWQLLTLLGPGSQADVARTSTQERAGPGTALSLRSQRREEPCPAPPQSQAVTRLPEVSLHAHPVVTVPVIKCAVEKCHLCPRHAHAHTHTEVPSSPRANTCQPSLSFPDLPFSSSFFPKESPSLGTLVQPLTAHGVMGHLSQPDSLFL